MSAIKILIQAPEKAWSVSFQQEEIFVGRGGDVPLDIQIPDPTVSRYHGRIWLSPDGYWYEDNNSTHGSKKNDALMMGPVRIFSGDVLRIGESDLTIELADHCLDVDLDVLQYFIDSGTIANGNLSQDESTLTYAPNGDFYSIKANFGSGFALCKHDLENGEIIDEKILPGPGWASLCLSSDGNHAFIGNFFNGQIGKFDLISGQMIASVETNVERSLAGIAEFN